MDLEEGKIYRAYLKDDFLKNFLFRILSIQDLISEVGILEGLKHVEPLKVYLVALDNFIGDIKFIEISPYLVDRKEKKARILNLGYLVERRRFLRFPVSHLKVQVESQNFKGILENISIGGIKIKLIEPPTEKIKEGEPIFVEVFIPQAKKMFPFFVIPVKITDNFISAKFEGPVKVTSELFNTVVKLLKKEKSHVGEKRKFRRLFVEPLNILVDTPVGMGILYDISIKGFKVKVHEKEGDINNFLNKELLITFRIPSINREYIVEAKALKSSDGSVSFTFTKVSETVLELLTDIVQLLLNHYKLPQ
jgi:hypothetical protein